MFVYRTVISTFVQSFREVPVVIDMAKKFILFVEFPMEISVFKFEENIFPFLFFFFRK